MHAYIHMNRSIYNVYTYIYIHVYMHTHKSEQVQSKSNTIQILTKTHFSSSTRGYEGN